MVVEGPVGADDGSGGTCEHQDRLYGDLWKPNRRGTRDLRKRTKAIK